MKYLVDYSKDNIKEIDIIRETEKCVYIACGSGERRVAKLSTWGNYFDSWDDAYTYLINNVNNEVESAERRFKAACEKRVKVESLEESKS